MNAAVVKPLPTDRLISAPRVQAFLTPSVEEFRCKTGFAQGDPESTTLAVWLEMKNGAPRQHQFIVGGPPIRLKFPLSVFGNSDCVSEWQNCFVEAEIDPSAISFRPGSNVEVWQPLQAKFRDTLTCSGNNNF